MRKFTTIILLWSTFSILSTQVWSQNTDIKILKSINSSTPNGLRQYSIFISKTTVPTAITIPLVMASVAVIEKDDDLFKNAIYVGASMGINTGLTYMAKYTVKRERPYDTYSYIDAPYPESSYSFPSGHTSLAFATATALSLKYPKWYIIAPGYFWACSVGYSRMNLGVHYPSDVLGGALLGAGSAYITYKVNNWFWKKKEDKKLIGMQNFM